MKHPTNFYRSLRVTSYDLTAYFMEYVGHQAVMKYQAYIRAGKVQPVYEAFLGFLVAKFGYHAEFSEVFLDLALLFSDDPYIYYRSEQREIEQFAEVWNNSTKDKINKWKQ